MRKRANKKSNIILWWALLADLILFVGLAVIFGVSSDSTLDKVPEQKAQVTIVRKEENKYHNYVYFQFKDGVEMEFDVEKEDYESLQENQSGTLIYRSIYPSNLTSEREFIRFETEHN